MRAKKGEDATEVTERNENGTQFDAGIRVPSVPNKLEDGKPKSKKIFRRTENTRR